MVKLQALYEWTRLTQEDRVISSVKKLLDKNHILQQLYVLQF